MKLLAICLALAALPAPGQTRLAGNSPIALYTRFQEAPSAPALKAVREELSKIMSPMGLRFEWRRVDGRRKQPVADLAVVTFKGRCNASDAAATPTTPSRLGWTHVSDGEILPFSDIDCDGIRGFVQDELRHVNQKEREATYGRAVGRVLAHELYHIFANTQRHGVHGVAKATYTVKELLSSVFRFEERESKALVGEMRAAVDTPQGQ